jgi:F-type H+-transporting ATPase subunit epsilon
MAPTFNVSIQSREAKLYEGSAVSLVAPGEMGYLGILHSHAPIVTTLKRGKITVRTDSGKTILIKSDDGGFMDVLKDHVSIVLESGEVVR